MLTELEISAIDPLLDTRNDSEIAAVLTSGQPPRRTSVRVEDLFDALYRSGDYATLKQAQLSGNPIAVTAFAFLQDAKNLGSGLVDIDAALTIAQFDALQAADLLSQVGRDAVEARGWADADPVNINKLSDALNAIAEVI